MCPQKRGISSIFSDMVEESMVVFMDDFSIVRDLFEEYLYYLAKVLQ